MREFFKGWRRKAGGVTLVMACMFISEWRRSEFIKDDFHWNPDFFGVKQDGFTSMKGHLIVSAKLPFTFARDWPEWCEFPIEPKYSHLRFGWATFNYFESKCEVGTEVTRTLVVPYWSIVVPLTLLSAWLLLSRPRPPAPKTPAPAPTTGT